MWPPVEPEFDQSSRPRGGRVLGWTGRAHFRPPPEEVILRLQLGCGEPHWAVRSPGADHQGKVCLGSGGGGGLKEASIREVPPPPVPPPPQQQQQQSALQQV